MDELNLLFNIENVKIGELLRIDCTMEILSDGKLYNNILPIDIDFGKN